jgi:drug/metabolite transporter (DMT)-like permease
MLKKGMIGDQGQSDQSIADVVARTWWNVVQPFPNWIYAALGITWILFALLIFQQTRRRWALAAAFLVVPVVAFATNTSDGTRDLALPITPLLLAAATVIAARATPSGPKGDPGFSPRVLGTILVLCLIVPVIDINPHTPLNPYQWLGLRGLSVVWHALGQ